MAVRDGVRALAEASGLGERAHDVAVATGEVIANAFEHGRPPVVVTASWDGRLRVEVHDHGGAAADPAQWGLTPPAADTGRGRGMWIVRQLTDRLDVHHGPDGTRVHIEVAPEDDGDPIL